MGHYANRFPEKEESAADNVVVEIIESKDGEAGGDFTFNMMGEENPGQSEEYELEMINRRWCYN